MIKAKCIISDNKVEIMCAVEGEIKDIGNELFIINLSVMQVIYNQIATHAPDKQAKKEVVQALRAMAKDIEEEIKCDFPTLNEGEKMH